MLGRPRAGGSFDVRCYLVSRGRGWGEQQEGALCGVRVFIFQDEQDAVFFKQVRCPCALLPLAQISYKGSFPKVTVLSTHPQKAFDVWGSRSPGTGLSAQMTIEQQLLNVAFSTQSLGTRFSAERRTRSCETPPLPSGRPCGRQPSGATLSVSCPRRERGRRPPKREETTVRARAVLTHPPHKRRASPNSNSARGGRARHGRQRADQGRRPRAWARARVAAAETRREGRWRAPGADILPEAPPSAPPPVLVSWRLRHKIPRAGSLNNRRLCSRSAAGGSPSPGSGVASFRRTLSPACGRTPLPATSRDLTQVHQHPETVGVSSSSYEDATPMGSEHHPVTSFNLS